MACEEKNIYYILVLKVLSKAVLHIYYEDITVVCNMKFQSLCIVIIRVRLGSCIFRFSISL